LKVKEVRFGFLYKLKFYLSLFPILGSSLFVLSLFFLSPEYSRAAEEPNSDSVLSIGRMKIAIWPEYDDPGVLVIYDGRFAEASRFPLKTSFFIPKGAVISDACSLSPKGQHFCQLYKTTNRGEFDEVRLFLPFPNFYLSFHTYPYNRKSAQRAFDYQVKINHKIEKLQLDIQQPLRSSLFTINPGSKNVSIIKDFNHFKYDFNQVASGENKSLKITYSKKDRLPSVDIKYSRMSGDKLWGSPYETQRQIKNIVYIVFFTGIAVLLLVGGLFFYKRKQRV